MPRKDWNKEIDDRLERYRKQYDVENDNDIASLRAMCALEVGLERQQKALLSIDPIKFPKKIKDIQGAIRDATNSYIQYQKDLGIDRRKRKADDEGLSVVDYIDRLKAEAKNILDRRLKKVICPKCGQVVAKYYVYIESSGAEPGSIDAEKTPPTPMKYGISVQCWKCWDKDKKVVFAKARWK